jgi:hypothetical protein
MDAVAKGDNLSQRSDISDDTIRQYLSAAVSYLRSNFAIDVPIFITKTSAGKIVTVKKQKYIPKDVGFSIFFGKKDE